MTRFPKLDLNAVALVAMAVFGAIYCNLADPDYFWHLQAGRWIVEHGHLPETDPFMWTQEGRPWILHEWLFEVLLWLLHARAGEVGVCVAAGLLLALTGWLVLSIVHQHVQKTFAICLTFVACGLLFQGDTPRPQLFTYVFFAYFLRQLLRHEASGRVGTLVSLPFMMLAWANLHGGYFIGLVLLGLFAVMRTLEAGWDRGFRQPGRWLRAGTALWVCLLMCVVAVCVNPYHVKHLLFPFLVMGLWVTPLIQEWQPTTFGNARTLFFFLLVGIWLLSLVLRQGRVRMGEWMLGGAFVLLALYQNRHIPLAGIVLGAELARSLALGWPRWRPELLHRFGRWFKPGAAGRDLGAVQYPLNAALILAMLAVPALLLPGKSLKDRENMNPIIGYRAIEFLASHPQPGRLFNEYGFGGYIAWRLWPGQKAFVDGRADIFDDAFAKEYFQIMNGEEGALAAFDKRAIATVVVRRNAPLRQLLLQRGDFREAFSDKDNVVLVRRP